MGVTNYISTHGMIWGEISDTGVTTSYGHDALGSVTETFVNGAVENTYRYKPYGGLLSKTGTAPDPSFRWNGGSGYRAAGLSYSDVYVRARHLSSTWGLWTTVDPMWPRERQYAYSGNRSVTFSDPTGLACTLSGNMNLTVSSNPCEIGNVNANALQFQLKAYNQMHVSATIVFSPQTPCICKFVQCYNITYTTVSFSGETYTTERPSDYGPCRLLSLLPAGEGLITSWAYPNQDGPVSCNSYYDFAAGFGLNWGFDAPGYWGPPLLTFPPCPNPFNPPWFVYPWSADLLSVIVEQNFITCLVCNELVPNGQIIVEQCATWAASFILSWPIPGLTPPTCTSA